MSEAPILPLPFANRTVFFVSDIIGINAKTFCHSVLTQFELRFKQVRIPFIDKIGKAYDAECRVNEAFMADNSKEYKNRIEAINFSLAHDDGQSNKNLASANVILVGISRSGKTPTSLYLALQYGIKAANYPLTPEDFEREKLKRFSA